MIYGCCKSGHCNDPAPGDVHEGDPVRFRDARGDWHEGTAASGVQRGHKFRRVIVCTASGDAVPWPASDVEPLVSTLA